MLFRLKLFITSLIVFTSISGCMKLRTSDKKTIAKLAKSNVSAIVAFGKFKDKKLRYIKTTGNEDLPLVVFIHGAPGSSDAFLDYLADSNLSKSCRMISVDRLGYGYSEFGRAETSIETQAQSLKSIISENNNGKGIILVGHSFGGPIIAKFCMDNPKLINSLLMLAPAIDPQNEKILGIAHLGRVRPFRWLAPKAFRVATDEKFAHASELAKMKEEWAHIKIPVTHIHGNMDKIVPYENLSFSEKNIDSSYLTSITLDHANHFIPWRNKPEVIHSIHSHLDLLKRSTL